LPPDGLLLPMSNRPSGAGNVVPLKYRLQVWHSAEQSSIF